MVRPRSWRAVSGVLLIALLVFSPCTGINAQGKPSLALLSIDDSLFPQVTVLVSLSDERGIPITGMTEPNQWLVQEDRVSGEILRVEEVTGTDLPLSLVFVVDVSGSMAGDPLNRVREAAQNIVNNLLGPADQVALVTFSTDVQTRQPLTTNHADLLNAWPAGTEGDRTHLYDAIHQALQELATTPAGKRAVLLFSDGEDIGSNLTLEDVIAEAQSRSTPVYIVGYGTAERLKPQILSRLAQRTGGIALIATTPQEIPSKFEEIFSSLHTAYAVTYLSPTRADGSRHEMRITFSHSGVVAETLGYVTARPGNFQVSLELGNLPARELAERVWVEMGQNPVSPDIPYVSGEVELIPSNPGPGKLTRASFSLDDKTLGEGSGDQYVFTWDSSTAPPGMHALKVLAQDHVGNQFTQERPIAVVPPAYAKFSSPQAGAAISGTVPIRIQIESIEMVEEIALFSNGTQLDLQKPPPANSLIYEYQWNVREVPEGDYRLRVEVKTEGEFLVKYELPIHVGPHVVVSIRAPADQAKLQGQTEIQAMVDSDAPIKEVRFFVNDHLLGVDNTVPYTVPLDTRHFPPMPATIRVEATNVHDMTGSASINVSLTPGSEGGISTLVTLLGIALTLACLPILWILLRRRKRQPSRVSPTGVGLSGKQSGRERYTGWLIGEQGPLANQRFPLRAGENRIGRDPQFANIVIPDPHVSRRHAIILVSNQGVMIANQNKYNPTIINGRPVTNTVPLNDGDRIQLGSSVFRIEFVR